MTQGTTNTPEIVTIRQAAKRKILPERTLRRLAHEGRIPIIQSGRTKYLNLTALIEQLNSGAGDLWSK